MSLRSLAARPARATLPGAFEAPRAAEPSAPIQPHPSQACPDPRTPHGSHRYRMSRTRSRLRRDDRGSSVIELAVLAPGFLMIIMLIVQFGLWFNARQAALDSAQAGAQVAREDAATNGNWQSLAQQASSSYYDSLNSSLLSSLQANAHGDPANQVFVTVQGPLGYSVFNFFGIKWTVTETAGGPVECFRPAAGGGRCG
jgi:Flp pilus assembly protein TadG